MVVIPGVTPWSINTGGCNGFSSKGLSGLG